MGRADLHIHTNASDGNMAPEEVVRLAVKHKLDVISITDHDTIAGYKKAEAIANELDITLLPGVELTTDFKGREIHLLAYCFDPEDTNFKEMLTDHYHSRLKRGKWILDKLAKEGFELNIDEVKAEAQGGNVGRPHIAAVLVDKGYVGSFKEAFIRYLSDDALGRIYNEYHSFREVIETVKQAGGATVIAHPGNMYSFEELETLVSAGIDGIETIHPSHDYETQQKISDFAKKHNLLTTGGSDFHGGDQAYQKFFGVVTINTSYVNRLKRMTKKRRQLNI